MLDTIFMKNNVGIDSFCAVVGKKESEGPLCDCFETVFEDSSCGQASWEKAESVFQITAISKTLEKSAKTPTDIDFLFGGDLQNQCTASSYSAREFPIKYIGLYGACSNMCEGLGLAACFVEKGLAKNALAVTSSHFCSAERQFRTPLDYGAKRHETAQWTVTGAGCVLVNESVAPPFIKAVTFGRVCDFEVKDVNNMGAAMAPAAVDTLLRYLKDSETKVEDFDAIYTGDLGAVGSLLFEDLLNKEGIKITNHKDCGLLIFDIENQNVKCGGSGCGCSASVLCGHILPLLQAGIQKRVLMIATGALMSPTTSMQKESIPAIAHLVEIENKPLRTLRDGF